MSIAKGVVTTIFGVVIIAFLTLFMLLEGPSWRTRLVALIPQARRPSTERICSGIYRAVGGFVAGDLLASLLAGLVATIVLLITGVPYAFPLGLFAAFIEFVPYLGPLVVTIVLGLVAATQGLITGAVVVGLLLLYRIVEGHTLRPLIYGRALKLSAISALIAILIGTEVAGILGALAAIPVAGAMQVIFAELRRAPVAEAASRAAPASAGGEST
jgi:predicted PurR-regulated permease PerM